MVEMPLEQTLQFQRNVAKVLKSGMEAQNRVQNRSVEMMQGMVDSYLRSFGDVVETTEEVAEQRQAISPQQQRGQQAPQERYQQEGYQQGGYKQEGYQRSPGQANASFQTVQQPPRQQPTVGGFQPVQFQPGPASGAGPAQPQSPQTQPVGYGQGQQQPIAQAQPFARGQPITESQPMTESQHLSRAQPFSQATDFGQTAPEAPVPSEGDPQRERGAQTVTQQPETSFQQQGAGQKLIQEL